MPSSEVEAWIGFFEYSLPFRHLTVTGIEQRIHTHSANSHRMFRLLRHFVRLQDDRFVQDNSRTWFKRGDQIAQYAYAVLVRPVVKNRTEEVDLSAANRLFRKGVMHSILHSISNNCRSLLPGFFNNCFVQILRLVNGIFEPRYYSISCARA